MLNQFFFIIFIVFQRRLFIIFEKTRGEHWKIWLLWGWKVENFDEIWRKFGDFLMNFDEFCFDHNSSKTPNFWAIEVVPNAARQDLASWSKGNFFSSLFARWKRLTKVHFLRFSRFFGFWRWFLRQNFFEIDETFTFRRNFRSKTTYPWRENPKIRR